MVKAVVAVCAAFAVGAAVMGSPAFADKKKPKCPEGMIYKPSTNKCVWPSGSF